MISGVGTPVVVHAVPDLNAPTDFRFAGTRYNFTFVNPEDIDVVHRHPHLGRHLLDSTAGATPPPPASKRKLPSFYGK